MAELQAKTIVNGLVSPLRCEPREGLRDRIISEISSCVTGVDSSCLNQCVNWLWSNYNFLGLCELKTALGNIDQLTLKVFKVKMSSYRATRCEVLRDLIKREVQLI